MKRRQTDNLKVFFLWTIENLIERKFFSVVQLMPIQKKGVFFPY